MGARDFWDRMLVYFGITEEMGDPGADESRSRRSSTALDEFDMPPAAAPRRPSRRSSAPARSAKSRDMPSGGVGVISPRKFNDAQLIADQFKRGLPVIVNFQVTDAELARRVVDFASGLTYGLDGTMQEIAHKVFLLTPQSVEVSAEERAAILENGFFNQS